MTASLRRWVDRNIVAIGVVLLCVGLVATMLSTMRDVLPLTIGERPKEELSLIGLAGYVLVSLANPFTYDSVLLIIAGLVLRRSEVHLVGFENDEESELSVEGPDEASTVWLGRRFSSAFDAEVAASALRARFKAAAASD